MQDVSSDVLRLLVIAFVVGFVLGVLVGRGGGSRTRNMTRMNDSLRNNEARFVFGNIIIGSGNGEDNDINLGSDD